MVTGNETVLLPLLQNVAVRCRSTNAKLKRAGAVEVVH